MRVLKRRSSAVAAALGLAVAASLFVLPATAGAVAVDNACRNSVTANNSQISVDTSGTDSPDPVSPGGTMTLSTISQTANVPGSIFVAGYNLGLLTVGNNTIPATVSTFIEGTNTTQGVQQTPFVATSISTTISDPDGTPGTGDETATDGSFTVNYPDQTWAAGPGGSTIDFREDTRTPLSVATGAEVGGIIIRATIGGFLSVRFACSPGTVTPPDPGTVTFIDPAPSFQTTLTCLGPPAISIDDVSVSEGGAATFTISLGGCPGEATVDYATSDGTAIAPDDYVSNSGTLTFAPGVTSQTVTVQTIDDGVAEATETFDVNLSNPTNGANIVDSQGVGTILNVPAVVNDGVMDLIVSGPTRTGAGDKSVVAKVTNAGTASLTVCDTDIDWNIEVNGVPTTGTVSPKTTGCFTLAPGASKRFTSTWTYGAGEVSPGVIVDYSATVNVTNEATPNNNTDTETRAAK